jgi:hypothetical protein
MQPNQGLVKSVLSGDTLVLTPIANRRLERSLCLAFVNAPRLRREGDEVRFIPYEFICRAIRYSFGALPLSSSD